jgi:hypothetical protein
MQVSSRARTAIGIAAALMVIVVGCTPQQETQASAEANLCQNLAAFGSSVDALIALDPQTATIEDVQAARDEIDAAWNDVVASAGDVSEADQAAVEDAWNGVAQSIEDFPTDQPVADGLAQVQAAAGDVQSAREEMENGAGCT